MSKRNEMMKEVMHIGEYERLDYESPVHLTGYFVEQMGENGGLEYSKIYYKYYRQMRDRQINNYKRSRNGKKN